MEEPLEAGGGGTGETRCILVPFGECVLSWENWGDLESLSVKGPSRSVNEFLFFPDCLVMMCKTVGQVDRGVSGRFPGKAQRELIREKDLGGKREPTMTVTSLAFVLFTHLGLMIVGKWRQCGHSTGLSEGSRLEGCQAAGKK